MNSRPFHIAPIRPAACPGCGVELDGSLCVTGQVSPVPGHLNLCQRCGYLSIFSEAMDLRPLTEDERQHIGPKTRALLDRVERLRQRTATLPATIRSAVIHVELERQRRAS